MNSFILPALPNAATQHLPRRCCMRGSFADHLQVGEEEDLGPVSEEMACVMGSVVNTTLFTLWTLIYTVPRCDN